MSNKKIVLTLAAAGVIAAGSYGVYYVGMQQGMKMATPAAMSSQPTTGGPTSANIDPATGRKVLYWHDPMVPGHKFDKPGKSPFMDMQLVPVYAEEAGDEGKVSISPQVQQNLGIRTAVVTTGSLNAALSAVGSVAYNERDIAVVQARSNGFVERLYVRAPLDPVKKGQPLAQLYVPEWVAAQEEYLSVKRMGKAAGTDGLLDAAQQRMRLVGMTEEQIRLVASSGKAQPRMTIAAPVSGVVTELSAREGMTMMAGAPLFRINGLSTVWVNAEIPESAASQVKPGTTVQAQTAALPGVAFEGKVGAILPEVNAATRTLKARIELANRNNQLVPGMFVTVSLRAAARKDVVLVPTEAVIHTGTRSVVMVALDDGKFQPVDVDIGTEASGQTEIRKGLGAGQKVVVSGQFLIDSEASLRAATNRMGEAPSSSTPPASQPGSKNKSQSSGQTHQGEAKVEAIGEGGVTLSHGPIPSLQWGAMTMGFTLPANVSPKNIAVGDSVIFEFRLAKEGEFEITSIRRKEAAHQHGAAGVAGASK